MDGVHGTPSCLAVPQERQSNPNEIRRPLVLMGGWCLYGQGLCQDMWLRSWIPMGWWESCSTDRPRTGIVNLAQPCKAPPLAVPPHPQQCPGDRDASSPWKALWDVGGRTQVLCFVTRGILPTSAVGFCLNRDYFSKNCRDILSLFIESDEEVQGMQKLTLPFQFPLLLDHLKLHFKISVFYLMRFLSFHTKDSHKTHLQR